jgi:hypothetical protein
VPVCAVSNRLFFASAFTVFQLLSSICAFGQSTEVRQVEISSAWGGLGTPAKTELTITRAGSTFRLGRQTIAPELLKSLVLKLQESEIPEPNLGNLGLTHEWLIKNHEMPPDHYQGGPEVGAPNQKALFQRKFEDEAFMSRILSTIYKSSFHTDDYPSVRVRLTFEDGTVMTASSRSQQPYMLPWSVERPDAKFVTYNANISRVLVAILPKKTVNRSRISGDGLVDILKTDISRAIEPESNLLDAENRAASALSKLRKHYTVLSAEINGYHHVEYGTQWSENQPHEENLHVTLKKRGLPPSLVDAVVLEYGDGKIEGVDTFLGEINKYENLVLSVPWLADYMHAHEKVRFLRSRRVAWE